MFGHDSRRGGGGDVNWFTKGVSTKKEGKNIQRASQMVYGWPLADLNGNIHTPKIVFRGTL